MPGLIGKKIGMTSVFSEEGKNIPCTILEVGPCTVTQIKTEEADGYNAVQIGFDEQKDHRVNKSLKGHFNKAKSPMLKKLVEFNSFEDINLGDTLTTELFEEGDYVEVAGTSKGKVFKGMRMGGQMGNARVKVENLQVVKIIADRNLILVNGSVPGANNSYITIEK